MEYALHVVNKHNNAEHASFRLTFAPTPLSTSSIRVQSELLGVSSNNILYARTGLALAWWDAFPVPGSAPAPYKDAAQWGVMPSWGFARVLESTVPDIAAGSYLWGFWPTTPYPVDLKLAPAEPKGHWLEVSPHRKNVFNLNNRYVQAPGVDAWAASRRPVWECAYLMNRYTFAAPRSGVAPAHPLGMGLPWTEKDADLRQAVVVSLSASSKTGRSFAWQLAHNRDVKSGGPLALLQATSAPSALSDLGSSLPVKTVSYDALGQKDTISWIQGFKPARIVVINFGAPDSAVKTVASALDKMSLTVIGVGMEGKVTPANEPQTEQGGQLEVIQLNTTFIRDHAMQVEGHANYFKAVDAAWEEFVEKHSGDQSKLTWRYGVEGSEGMHGLWDELCGQKLRPGQDVVLKFKL
ncbi:hypothetical protein AURDEDRAFT_157987 [Auricularia subglabra TFB-10046 SS5]|nr:hypothetical protein AURDEDRAFT_157987 [Auricularia subglabra TFB-10046 SS5]